MRITEGLILKKTDVGEADAFFAIYTRDFGKIRVLAKGIKKEGAKLKGHADIFNIISLAFARGKSADRLMLASLVERWPQIRASLEKISAAIMAAEFINDNCFVGQKDEKIWNILISYFKKLENVPRGGTIGADAFFEEFRRNFFEAEGTVFKDGNRSAIMKK